jgi:hypothetical protein
VGAGAEKSRQKGGPNDHQDKCKTNQEIEHLEGSFPEPLRIAQGRPGDDSAFREE